MEPLEFFKKNRHVLTPSTNPSAPLIQALRKDKQLYDAYKANIAVCMQDAIHRHKLFTGKKSLSRVDIAKATNQGADDFLKLLIAK